MKLPTLTVAIIALNEERNLQALLPCLSWADDLVVVDGGSRDRTVEVAREHRARVLTRRFDNYASQRNFALAVSRGDWVLMLDADERPTEAFIAELHTAIADDRLQSYRVPIRSHIFGRPVRYSGTQDDRPTRLVRREAAQWRGEVHEVCEIDGRIGTLQYALEHHTLPNLGAFLDKMHRYTRIEAQARVARVEAPRPFACWWAPPREFFRRLVWKLGALDGPHGWAFCFLSALSEWVLAREHARRWEARRQDAKAIEPFFPRLAGEARRA